MPIYFLRAGLDGPVKIGWSPRPQERAKTLQCGSAEEVTLIRIVPGGKKDEARLHRHYASRHVRGEWFKFDQSMLSVDPKTLPPPEKRPNKPPGPEKQYDKRLFVPVNDRILAKLDKLAGPRKRAETVRGLIDAAAKKDRQNRPAGPVTASEVDE